jgi:DNA repair protein RadD
MGGVGLAFAIGSRSTGCARGYTAVEIDTSDVAVRSTGEWDDSGLEREGVKIVGDVVAEYIKRTGEHFGGPAKTIVFSSTVAHGEEICRAFAQIGLNFQNISYHDDEDERRAKIAEFRKPDSAITGLVSCDALAKGFDVPDVLVCLLCRPLRKSLTTHIQQLGRVMRSSPGKDKALVIDHTGNSLRFLSDTVEFWAKGVDELNESAEKDRASRSAPTPKERQDVVCFGCQAIVPPGVTACLACGRERPRKPASVRQVQGATKLLNMSAESGRKFDYANHPILRDPATAYLSFLAFTTHRKRGDVGAGHRWAAGLFRGVYGRWPSRTYEHFVCNPEMLTIEVERFCRNEMARYSKTGGSRAAAA